MKRVRPLLLALLLALPLRAAAHEVRPAYLELREVGAERWEVLWRVPARGELRLGLDVVLPAACTDAAPRRTERGDGSFRERWTAHCPGGLSGRAVRVGGLAATLTDALVRVVGTSGATQVERLSPASPSFVVAEAPGVAGVAATYLALGVEHIALGLDHLLFVLALLLLVPGGRRLVATVTAFTVAHSITLAGATLGWLRLPGAPVEACIALSILFVAAEIVHLRGGRPSRAAERPWLVAFAFGLLHGFGFAGALHEVGLPEGAIPVALLFFNLGVEAGQLLFVALALAAAAALRRVVPAGRAWSWRVPPYAIGGVAAFWLIERLAAFA